MVNLLHQTSRTRSYCTSQNFSTHVKHYKVQLSFRSTINANITTEHDDSISRISSNLNGFQEEVKNLCSEVKSLKSDINNIPPIGEVISEGKKI